MAQKSPSLKDKTPPSDTPEEQYLDLWEEHIRLIAANGPTRKPQSNDG